MRKRTIIYLLITIGVFGIAITSSALTLRFQQINTMSAYWKANNITFTGVQTINALPDSIGILGIIGVFLTVVPIMLLYQALNSLIQKDEKK
jgi:hypothetical protein